MYVFPFAGITTSIPIFSIIIRYNLLENEICGKGSLPSSHIASLYPNQTRDHSQTLVEFALDLEQNVNPNPNPEPNTYVVSVGVLLVSDLPVARDCPLLYGQRPLDPH